jgi:hypothetical protein
MEKNLIRFQHKFSFGIKGLCKMVPELRIGLDSDESSGSSSKSVSERRLLPFHIAAAATEKRVKRIFMERKKMRKAFDFVWKIFTFSNFLRGKHLAATKSTHTSNLLTPTRRFFLLASALLFSFHPRNLFYYTNNFDSSTEVVNKRAKHSRASALVTLCAKTNSPLIARAG